MHLIGCSSLIDQASGETLGSYRTADKPNSELLVASRTGGPPAGLSCAETYYVDICHVLPGRPGRRQQMSPTPWAQQPLERSATLTAPGFGASTIVWST